MQEMVLFVLSFLFIFFVYQIVVVKRAKKKKNSYEPIEVLYLKKRYHLDMKKIHYPQLLQVVAITSSFDIALIVSIVMNIQSYLWGIIIGFISIFIIIYISYHIVYLFYKKKGMIKK